MLETGQVIEGKYRITRLIGTGGMGAVYEGENVLIRRRVAIKVLHADSASNADIIRRFEREAQAAGEIGDDHILEVLDLGSLPNGDRFMVMEYLDGETLAERILRYGQLTPQQVAPIARQFLAALISAHAAGIIHRDLKPENIFILRSKAGRADFVKLIDFGVSKFSRPFKEGEHRMTRANAVLGTPCYMSPEQARGASDTDVRSDIYSCGVILFEAVTGRLPFEGESFNDLMFKIALTDAPSVLVHVPTIDPAFAAIVARAVQRDPGARYASAQDFADALDGWMHANNLTESLSTFRSSGDAFPPAPAASKNNPTISLNASFDAISLGKTATHESWARSEGGGEPAKPSSGSRRGRIVVGSIAGLAVAILGIAAMVRARASQATRPPLPAVALVAAPAAAPGPPRSVPSASAAPSAEQPQALAPLATAEPAPTPPAPSPQHRKPDPAAYAGKGGGAAHPSPPSAAGKPRPAPASTSFDLGY